MDERAETSITNHPAQRRMRAEKAPTIDREPSIGRRQCRARLARQPADAGGNAFADRPCQSTDARCACIAAFNSPSSSRSVSRGKWRSTGSRPLLILKPSTRGSGVIAQSDRVGALGEAALVARLDQREAARPRAQEFRGAGAVGQAASRCPPGTPDSAPDNRSRPPADARSRLLHGASDERLGNRFGRNGRRAHRSRPKERSRRPRRAASSARGRRRHKATRRASRK